MTRDLIKPKASFETDRGGHRDTGPVADYRTRTPANSKKTGLRSASPTPYKKHDAYGSRSEAMSKQYADGALSYGYEKPLNGKNQQYADGVSRSYGYEKPSRGKDVQSADGVRAYGRDKPARGKGRGNRRGPLMERSGNAADGSGASDDPGKTSELSYDQLVAGPAQVTDPSFRPYSGIAIKGAATSDLSKTTMPKHFMQPLTCFYWHKNGFCTKSDEDCLYAHHYTGVVASAPVSVGGNKGIVAGRNAIQEVTNHAQREQELKELEARLAAKEMELNGKLAITNTVDNTQAVLDSIHQTIANATVAADNARRVLNRRYEEVVQLLPKLSAIDDLETGRAVLAAIDGAIGAISGLELDFAGIEKEVEEGCLGGLVGR